MTSDSRYKFISNVGRKLLFAQIRNLEPRVEEARRHHKVGRRRQLEKQFRHLTFALCDLDGNHGIGETFPHDAISDELTAKLRDLLDVNTHQGHWLSPLKECFSLGYNEPSEQGGEIFSFSLRRGSKLSAEDSLPMDGSISSTAKGWHRSSTHAFVEPVATDFAGQGSEVDNHTNDLESYNKGNTVVCSNKESRTRLNRSRLSSRCNKPKEDLDMADLEAINNIKNEFLHGAWLGSHSMTVAGKEIQVPRIVNQDLETDLLCSACSEQFPPIVSVADLAQILDNTGDVNSTETPSHFTPRKLHGSGDGTSLIVLRESSSSMTRFAPDNEFQHEVTATPDSDAIQMASASHGAFPDRYLGPHDGVVPDVYLLNEALSEAYRTECGLQDCCELSQPSCALASIIASDIVLHRRE